ncbi:MAG: hypothetical protein JWN44_7191 [Myxococcales bacterium]|nr:hypothetical protein [Myxococcales bacterium]
MRPLAILLVLALARPAAAADSAAAGEPPSGAALGTGVALGAASLLAGGVLFASSDDDALRKAAIYVALAGLTIAPAVAHLTAREYKRAAIFAALPLAGFITSAIVLQVDPSVTRLGSAETRTSFGIAMCAGIVGATVGLIDVMGASDRWRARHPVVVAPTVVSAGGGLVLGGRF